MPRAPSEVPTLRACVSYWERTASSPAPDPGRGIARTELAPCSQPNADPGISMHSACVRFYRKPPGTPMGIGVIPGVGQGLSCALWALGLSCNEEFKPLSLARTAGLSTCLPRT